ncbi:hypothetical protein KGF54_000043 [Candida jiufengensis]|uniref:uncharacterized protein n=1 Tax=Candida jiufengensis TaxID=497108 RepID=UPI00222417C0|nr:uncharacterized protein KGF54_000043 [Candida jiufengensis]KAI5957115.1 hypothetical protein KGF54_000043 [Candida jiufengensis]
MSSNAVPTKSTNSNNNNLTVPKSQHSYSTSIASNVSPQFFLNQNAPNSSKSNLLKPTSTASQYRLSRTNTNTTNEAYLNYDNNSIQTIDKIPSVKPSVTYSDKLWTQIDVLDDVKKLSEEVKTRGSFFNNKFNNELSKLKQSQIELLRTMSNAKFNDMNNTNELQKQQLYQLGNSRAHASGPLTRATTNASMGHLSENLLKVQEEEEEEEEENENENDNKKTNSNQQTDEQTQKSKIEQEVIKNFFESDDVTFENDNSLYTKETFEEIKKYVKQIKTDLKGLGNAIKEFDNSTSKGW